VKAGKVAPLSDEDRLTLVRGSTSVCPIDLDYDPKKPAGTQPRLACSMTSGRR